MVSGNSGLVPYSVPNPGFIGFGVAFAQPEEPALEGSSVLVLG